MCSSLDIAVAFSMDALDEGIIKAIFGFTYDLKTLSKDKR